MYAVDGVTITDSACGGCSSAYFDFDAFDEIKVETGGNDLSVMTGGVGMNFVTKRGTNEIHGSVRSFFSHDDLQWGNVPSELANDSRLQLADGSFSDKAEHIDQINDWGLDIGGPLVKDKLWFWAAFNRNDIRLVRFNQTKDKTVLKNWNAKVNWQASQKDNVSFFFFNGAKEKFGRAPGYVGNEPDSFLWNQGNDYADSGCGLPCGLHGLFKVEDNHIFSPNFFVTAKYALYNWGYSFTPRGGTDQNAGVDYDGDVAYGSWLSFSSKRPWHIVDVSGSVFKSSSGGGQHEFKFGFGYRRNPVTSTTTFSGNSTPAFDFGGGAGVVWVMRDRLANFLGQNWHAFFGDSFSKGRFTLNAGVRWDRQTAENRDSEVRGNPLFPDLVPAVTFNGSTAGKAEWTSFSPRVSMTYALDESNKTVVRASYASYAGQLNALDVLDVNTTGAYYPYLAYNWVDLNGDHFAQRDEVLVGEGVQYSNVIDPNDPTNTSSVNRIDPDWKPNRDHEVIVGIEHELAPNLAVSAAYTWRRVNDFPLWRPRIGLTRDDYTANDPVTVATDIGTFTSQTYSPDPDLVAASGGGRLLTNRPDYHRGYSGLELSATKRLANRWMMRAAFSWMDWKEYIDGPNAAQNPTSSEPRCCGDLSGPLVDGGQVLIRSYGGKGDTYFNSKWQVSASAMYQLPANFEIAGSLFGRQGYPYVIIQRISAGADGGAYRALGTPTVDSVRLEDVWTLDLRLSKTMHLAGRSSLVLTADLFNVLNDNAVLQRTRDAQTSSFNRINELINPRVARIGVRLQF